MTKEATARIKINKLLEAAGWRFFANASGPANIRLEPSVTIKSTDLDALGDNFEKSGRGFVDFLLLDAKGFPLLVLEAKAEDKNPLVAKEQARKYARSQNCRFVILSNGNLHHFWDLERGNPYVITSYPTPSSVSGYRQVTPNPQRLIAEQVGDDYIVLTQRPNYQAEAGWKNEAERPAYVQANKLRFLRAYQRRAIQSLQSAAKDGKDRFLFEMATGTGKTLTAAAVIKLFLRSGIFFSTPAALERKIAEILRIVDLIQNHSRSVIEHCYRDFLLLNHDPEEREYPDAVDQIREVLIHTNYLSQKDIEICLAFDVESLANKQGYESMRDLHEALRSKYGADDVRGAAAPVAPPVTA